MPPAPRPTPRSPVPERAATCLETDEDVMAALRENLAIPTTPPPPFPQSAVPLPVQGQTRHASPPVPARQPTVAIYRPTLRPPMAVLTAQDDGKSDGEQFRLRDARFVIGRSEGDLVVPHDAMISSRHVEITRQTIGAHQRWVITDLQSTNGMFVRVSRTPLADQSEFLVGKGRYRLLVPTRGAPVTTDYVPAEGARHTTQAWGDDGAAPAVPALVEVLGNAVGNRVLLLGEEYWIGTDPGCAICRTNDPYCEARHTRLFRDAKGVWHMEPNKAINGLWFRMPQVVCETLVQFQIGEQRFRLKVGG
ncbi:MAG TPA: FHA domain-containing protein [Pirellulales bacterium]|nr:FHA domain-containing protein [Pirellulales bacterium]